jgi:hypothetical protein
LVDAVEMHPIPGASEESGSDGLWATHVGRLVFGEFSLTCYQLNDGSRVLDADEVERLFAAPLQPEESREQ